MDVLGIVTDIYSNWAFVFDVTAGGKKEPRIDSDLPFFTAGFKVSTLRVEFFFLENIIITFESFKKQRRKPDKPPMGLKKFHFFVQF